MEFRSNLVLSQTSFDVDFFHQFFLHRLLSNYNITIFCNLLQLNIHLNLSYLRAILIVLFFYGHKRGDNFSSQDKS